MLDPREKMQVEAHPGDNQNVQHWGLTPSYRLFFMGACSESGVSRICRHSQSDSEWESTTYECCGPDASAEMVDLDGKTRF